MKALLMSIGTRGDCEPFLGVGEMLRARGVEVVCSFPEQYRGLAEESGFAFRSLGPEFLALLDSDAGRLAMGSGKGGLEKLRATIRVGRVSIPIQERMIDLQHDIVEELQPDVIVFHPKVTYPLPWSLRTGRRIVLLSTVPCMIHEVKGRSNVGINKNLGVLNPLTYKLVNFATSIAVMTAVKRYFTGQFTRGRIGREMLRMRVAYEVSPALFPRPGYWPANAIVAGFWERDATSGFTPEPGLAEFLDRHPRILFVTFGSMVNSDPAGRTALFGKVLAGLGIPAVINISGGGFAVPAEYDPSMVFFTRSVPYGWAFPRMQAVVHHGGAGTTHSALKAGCATMAIPHAADQPMWDDLIAASGAGPKGIGIARLEEELLSAKLQDLFTNPAYKAAAERIAATMAREDHADELFGFITEGMAEA